MAEETPAKEYGQPLEASRVKETESPVGAPERKVALPVPGSRPMLEF